MARSRSRSEPRAAAWRPGDVHAAMFDSDGDGGSEAPDDVLDAEAHANANRDDATEPAVNDDVVSDADSCVDGSGVEQASDDEPTTPRSGELEAPCASSHDGEDAAHDDDLLAMLVAPIPASVTRALRRIPVPDPLTEARRAELEQEYVDFARERDRIAELTYFAITRERDRIEELPLLIGRRFRWAVQFDTSDANDRHARTQIRAVAARGVRFKVGITASPRWRMLGGTSLAGNLIAGHSDVMVGWESMVVIAARMGRSGPRLEKDLIEWSWDHYGEQCANEVGGGGGIAVVRESVTFLYVLSM